MIYEYYIETSAGNITLATDLHHTSFSTPVLWLRHLRAQVAADLKISAIGLEIRGVYLGERKIR